jgi:UrcA family protein
MKTLIAVLGCLVLTGVTHAALADANARHAGKRAADADSDAPRSVVVSYRFLDLSNPEDARVLYRRIRHAAESVCPKYTQRDLQRLQVWRTCYDTAVTSAIAKVDQPALTELRAQVGRTTLP